MRVLILSCNTGEGHNSCGKAIQEVFRENGIHCEMEDALRFISPRVSSAISFSFVKIYRYTPGLFRSSYQYLEKHPEMFKRKSKIYQFLSTGTERLYQFIEANQYDTVICPHVFSALMLTEVIRRYHVRLRTCFVATDYTCSPSCAQSDLDIYFIPDESLAEDFFHCGIPKEKLVASGIPIRKEFYEKQEQAEAKRKIGLAPGDRHLLIMCGSMGCGPIKKLVESIVQSMPDNCRVSVVCGTNHRLRQALEKAHSRNGHVKTYGYLQNIPAMMDSADLFLTKPGGISVTEATQKQLPMVFVDAVAGCESYNMRFYIYKGVACSADSTDALAVKTLSLLSDASKLEHMKTGFDAIHKGNAAQEIAAYFLTASTT